MFTINSTGSTIGIGDGANAFAINIGTGAAARIDEGDVLARQGRFADAAATEVRPIDDLRATARYRRRLIGAGQRVLDRDLRSAGILEPGGGPRVVETLGEAQVAAADEPAVDGVGEAVDVEERQRAEQTVVSGEAPVPGESGAVGGEVAVRQHRAL